MPDFMESLDIPVADYEHTQLYLRYGECANERFNVRYVESNEVFEPVRKLFIGGAGPSFTKLPDKGFDVYLWTLPVSEALSVLFPNSYIVDGEYDRWNPYWYYPDLRKTMKVVKNINAYIERDTYPKDNLFLVGNDPPRTSGALAFRFAYLLEADHIEYAGIDLNGPYEVFRKETKREMDLCRTIADVVGCSYQGY